MNQDIPYNLEFTLSNTNPVNESLYKEAYEKVYKNVKFNTLLSNLTSKAENMDPNNINIYINTIYKEVLREMISKEGLVIDMTIDLKLLLEIVNVIEEIQSHVNISDILNNENIDDCTVEYLTNVLGIDISTDFKDAIVDDELFIERLYKG